MTRWEIALAAVGAILLAVSAWAMRRMEPPHRDTLIITDQCRMPVTILDGRKPARGEAILFHGLSADRRIMQSLADYLTWENGLRVYLFDLPGHGDNTDAFSFPRADDCARMVIKSLIRLGEIDPQRTVLIGHSMGGAIAIRAADREPLAATVALSPAPMPLPRRMPANLLIFSAQYDFPILRHAASALAHAAAGDRTLHDDFLQARAFHLEVVSRSDHTSLLTDPRVFRQTGDWIDRALELAGHPRTGSQAYSYANIPPLLGLLAILLMFPFCARVAAKLVGQLSTEDCSRQHAEVTWVLAQGAIAALATVLILWACVPLAFLHLYSGDYLASLLLVFGTLLLALSWKCAGRSVHWQPRALLTAVMLGFAVMLGIGAWLNWQTADLWLNEPRWLRFIALLPIMWLFCFAEEVILGPVFQGRLRVLRFFLFLAVRAGLWLACLFAYYALTSGQVLLLILVPSLAMFSILQRLATDTVRRHTGSVTAAALFSAILAAWFIAAVFPLT